MRQRSLSEGGAAAADVGRREPRIGRRPGGGRRQGGRGEGAQGVGEGDRARHVDGAGFRRRGRDDDARRGGDPKRVVSAAGPSRREAACAAALSGRCARRTRSVVTREDRENVNPPTRRVLTCEIPVRACSLRCRTRWTRRRRRRANPSCGRSRRPRRATAGGRGGGGAEPQPPRLCGARPRCAVVVLPALRRDQDFTVSKKRVRFAQYIARSNIRVKCANVFVCAITRPTAPTSAERRERRARPAPRFRSEQLTTDQRRDCGVGGGATGLRDCPGVGGGAGGSRERRRPPSVEAAAAAGAAGATTVTLTSSSGARAARDHVLGGERRGEAPSAPSRKRAPPGADAGRAAGVAAAEATAAAERRRRRAFTECSFSSMPSSFATTHPGVTGRAAGSSTSARPRASSAAPRRRGLMPTPRRCGATERGMRESAPAAASSAAAASPPPSRRLAAQQSADRCSARARQRAQRTRARASRCARAVGSTYHRRAAQSLRDAPPPLASAATARGGEPPASSPLPALVAPTSPGARGGPSRRRRRRTAIGGQRRLRDINPAIGAISQRPLARKSGWRRQRERRHDGGGGRGVELGADGGSSSSASVAAATGSCATASGGTPRIGKPRSPRRVSGDFGGSSQVAAAGIRRTNVLRVREASAGGNLLLSRLVFDALLLRLLVRRAERGGCFRNANRFASDGPAASSPSNAAIASASVPNAHGVEPAAAGGGERSLGLRPFAALHRRCALICLVRHRRLGRLELRQFKRFDHCLGLFTRHRLRHNRRFGRLECCRRVRRRRLRRRRVRPRPRDGRPGRAPPPPPQAAPQTALSLPPCPPPSTHRAHAAPPLPPHPNAPPRAEAVASLAPPPPRASAVARARTAARCLGRSRHRKDFSAARRSLSI